MGLFRLILFILAAWLIWWLIRPFFASTKKRVDEQKNEKIDTMVRCHHCGLNLPKNEAIADDAEHYYCCEAHLNTHKK
ncbi:MAG: preprotein translocase subunit YajC [Gammaproteobacteria bacterium]|nr:preprotein translocase subunit YajC [Gammaproteobacteria bacterium]